ncbi:MAG TPA: heavy-metal-associated domain-containing protein [Staphylococcus sp.]|nr:heavy-metal-associated domain-containing protein [Staphylococcus sp.]
MQIQNIYITGIKNETEQKQIEQRLTHIIGVKRVTISVEDYNGKIEIQFETPASLNNLEKEVYDLGYTIL